MPINIHTSYGVFEFRDGAILVDHASKLHPGSSYLGTRPNRASALRFAAHYGAMRELGISSNNALAQLERIDRV